MVPFSLWKPWLNVPISLWTWTPASRRFSSYRNSRTFFPSLASITSSWTKLKYPPLSNQNNSLIINFSKRSRQKIKKDVSSFGLLFRSSMQFYSNNQVRKRFMFTSKKSPLKFRKFPMISGTAADFSLVKISSQTNWRISVGEFWEPPRSTSRRTLIRTGLQSLQKCWQFKKNFPK